MLMSELSVLPPRTCHRVKAIYFEFRKSENNVMLAGDTHCKKRSVGFTVYCSSNGESALSSNKKRRSDRTCPIGEGGGEGDSKVEEFPSIVLHRYAHLATHLGVRGIASLRNTSIEACVDFHLSREAAGEEDVQTVLATNATEEDLVKLQENRRDALRAGKLILDNTDIILVQVPGAAHQGAVRELSRQFGNYIVPHIDHLHATGDVPRQGEFGGRAPDVVVLPMHGFPPEFTGDLGRGTCRVVVEFEDRHRSVPELRKHALFLANNSPHGAGGAAGNLLRAIVLMKLYDNGACIAVVYLPDALDKFQFSAAYSFGRAGLSRGAMFYWMEDQLLNHPAASMLPPIPNVAAITENLSPGVAGVPFNLSIPAGAIWYNIRGGVGGPFLPMPPGLGPLNIDLRLVAKNMS